MLSTMREGGRCYLGDGAFERHGAYKLVERVASRIAVFVEYLVRVVDESCLAVFEAVGVFPDVSDCGGADWPALE
jgi:hypothetical protein